MADGRVVEQGTHAQLLAAGGSYREMWELQREQREQQDATPAVPEIA